MAHLIRRIADFITFLFMGAATSPTTQPRRRHTPAYWLMRASRLSGTAAYTSLQRAVAGLTPLAEVDPLAHLLLSLAVDRLYWAQAARLQQRPLRAEQRQREALALLCELALIVVPPLPVEDRAGDPRAAA